MASIESLLLANHAEAQNGLLYISGGGWTELYRGQLGPNDEPPINHFGIAVSVLVPWDETNQQHHLVIQIEKDDGKELGRVEADFELGRPPGLPEGGEQHAALGIGADIAFSELGGHRIVAKVGDHERSVAFRVRDQSQMFLQR
jgi:hypothetical protein